MTTRTSTATADLPKVDTAALDTAMREHPVVLNVVERMAATRRGAEAERDQALAERDKARKDLATEKVEHRKTKAKFDVASETVDKMMKAIGTLPATLAAVDGGPQRALTEAEAMEKWNSWSPEERAAALMRAAPSRRFDIHGNAPAVEGMFGR